jgi:pimeloyl-ACP methyl ester carboxylesterase
VLDQLDREVDRGPDRGLGAPAARRDAGGTIGALLRAAHDRGEVGAMLPLLVEASRFLPEAGAPSERERGHVVRLAEGDRRPALVCVPSFVVGSGPHQFARFAERFAGERDVYACSLPGLRGDEPLPGSWDAAIDALAASIRAAVGEQPFALVGYSIGGVVVHSLAGRLARDGAAAAGMVLIDTPTPASGADDRDHVFATVMRVILDRDGRGIDDRSWLAMGAYLRLMRDAGTNGADTPPSLLIRAGRPLDGERPWPAWDVTDDVAVLPVDHFALIEGDVEATASTTDGWLRSHADDR